MITTRTGTAIRYIIAGALAASLVAGAASAGEEAPRQRAEAALAKGKIDRTITFGEAAVAANPRDAATRLVLAQAYLKAGCHFQRRARPGRHLAAHGPVARARQYCRRARW